MPCIFKVMEMLAKFSCNYVRDGRLSCSRLGKAVMVTRMAGGPISQQTINDMNKALTKTIKYFSRAVDVEALHLANGTGTSIPLVHPSQSIEAPISRLPVEIWQDILLLAIGSDGHHPFATTCTASTLIYFSRQERNPESSYIEYMRCRATLRQVCRAWNQFLESTDAWWVHVQGPYHPRRTFGLPPIVDQVAIVKRLSMTITTHECVWPALNWAYDLFQQVQVPILSFNIKLSPPYRSHFTRNPYDVLAPVTTKMALRNLRIACRGLNECGTISFAQLSINFQNLVSLSLSCLVMHSTEELTLPRLERLHVFKYPGVVPLPTQGWYLPRLRQVYIAVIPSTNDFNTVLDFLRRYASQLESLFLVEHPSRTGLPHDFWDSFTSLQLLGAGHDVLNHRDWNGWHMTPPRGHPFRYLACSNCEDPEMMAESLRSMWAFHEEVVLVLQKVPAGGHYLVEGIKQEDWRTRMTETNGILPMRHPNMGAIS